MFLMHLLFLAVLKAEIVYMHLTGTYNYASHKSWRKYHKNGVIIQKESCISIGYMIQLFYADYAKESVVASFRIKINELFED